MCASTETVPWSPAPGPSGWRRHGNDHRDSRLLLHLLGHSPQACTGQNDTIGAILSGMVPGMATFFPIRRNTEIAPAAGPTTRILTDSFETATPASPAHPMMHASKPSYCALITFSRTGSAMYASSSRDSMDSVPLFTPLPTSSVPRYKDLWLVKSSLSNPHSRRKMVCSYQFPMASLLKGARERFKGGQDDIMPDGGSLFML